MWIFTFAGSGNPLYSSFLLEVHVLLARELERPPWFLYRARSASRTLQLLVRDNGAEERKGIWRQVLSGHCVDEHTTLLAPQRRDGGVRATQSTNEASYGAASRQRAKRAWVLRLPTTLLLATRSWKAESWLHSFHEAGYIVKGCENTATVIRILQVLLSTSSSNGIR